MFFEPLSLILALFLCWLYPYAFVTWKTTQRVYECTWLETADPADLPAEIHEALQPHVQALEAANFQFVQYEYLHHGEVGDRPSWGLLFHDPTSTTYYCLIAPQPFHQIGIVLCDLITLLDDDHWVITSSTKNYRLFEGYPGESRRHLFNAPIPQLWQVHQDRLAEFSAVPVPLAGKDFRDRISLHNAAKTRFCVQTKKIHWVEIDKTYRYALKSATKLTTQVFRDMLLRQSYKKSQPQSEAAKTSQLQQEITTFLKGQVPQAPMPKRQRGWIALGSLAVFAAVYATIFGPMTLVIFLAALILHEGGHLLAMLVFGYRAPAVLFIPYLGALATARKDHATLTEKVWISLAGPLPGLILGVAIVVSQTHGTSIETIMTNWYSDGNRWREASQILIGLNLFNLLPIYPLDGGQISDLLVFSRNPYLGVIYKSIGVALLLLLGLFNPLMFVFGLLMALLIPSSFRVARWFAKLRRELRAIPWQDDAASAELIFTRLQSAPKLSSVQKSTIAAGIIESRRADTAPWWSRLGLSAIYLVSLLGGIMGGLYAIMPDVKAVASSVASAGAIFQGPGGSFRNRLKEANTAIANNPKDWDAYMKRAYAKLYLKDFQGTIDDASVYLSQDPKSFETHHRIKAYRLRASAYRELGDRAKAQADEHKAQEIQWMPQFQKAQAALKKNPKDLQAYIDRAEAKDGFDDRDGAFQDVAIALKINPKSADVLLMRSSLFERQQDYPAALKDLDRVIELEPNNADAYGSRSELYNQLGEDAKAQADEAKSLELFAQSPEGKANPKMVEAVKRLQSLPRDD
jgi:Zn-dependent protease/Flp pilus assembly protein TadD